MRAMEEFVMAQHSVRKPVQRAVSLGAQGRLRRGGIGRNAPFTKVELQALQRSAGNATVTVLLTKLAGRSGVTQPVVQRLGVAAGSDATLTNEYNALAATPAFQVLNRAVTTNTNITLVDSSIPGAVLGPVDYDSATHTIRVPLNQNGHARPLADVRDDLLWEMHNARNRGSFVRIGLPGVPVSVEDKRTHAARTAAAALAMEWAEWIRVAEQATRGGQINAALGAGYVSNSFAPQFAAANSGWFLFKNYMKDQLATGHTANYDPAASPLPRWVGHGILQRYSGSSSVKIADKEVNDWVNGRRMYIKAAANNPFTTYKPI